MLLYVNFKAPSSIRTREIVSKIEEVSYAKEEKISIIQYTDAAGHFHNYRQLIVG
jgi:hypothetical protein